MAQIRIKSMGAFKWPLPVDEAASLTMPYTISVTLDYLDRLSLGDVTVGIPSYCQRDNGPNKNSEHGYFYKEMRLHL